MGHDLSMAQGKISSRQTDGTLPLLQRPTPVYHSPPRELEEEFEGKRRFIPLKMDPSTILSCVVSGRTRERIAFTNRGGSQ